MQECKRNKIHYEYSSNSDKLTLNFQFSGGHYLLANKQYGRKNEYENSITIRNLGNINSKT